jgi:diguanylate cyclase (GGDEF)-like protein
MTPLDLPAPTQLCPSSFRRWRRRQSTRDALTGLYNRRYLEETLGRELILAERHGQPVSVIMADLDHFKAVNDRYGHLGGDEVLRVFGDLMKRQVRGSDIYCRYGGEEFLLVLPHMSTENAIERAEQLRSAMAAAPVPYGDSAIAVTASFGVATFPRDGRTGDELIAAADSALYLAKETGRNRVNVDSSYLGSPPGSAGEAMDVCQILESIQKTP